MSLDLNLLVSLDALLQERSVTRAAQRLGLSQPTLSAALARLRRHFGDELLHRVGNTYQLTPLAERLTEQTAQALTSTDRVFRTRPDFDPFLSQHEFTLVVADCHLPTFGRVLADLVHEEAPGVRLHFQHSDGRFVQRAHEYLRTVDAVALPQGLLAELPNLDLYQDRWVCVASASSPATGASTARELAGYAWVVPYHDTALAHPPLHRLRDRGGEVHVEVTTEDFLVVPHLVAGTTRLGLMPERAARLHSPANGTVVVDLPFELGILVETLWWHPMHDRDPAHTWLRQTAARAGQLVGADGAPGQVGRNR
ncbi:LysR family transcriptional regulator [Streptomyces bobili]|uniref:LysR family transcriptional regulator n=1 Tax=Streptomyces bobili TaxID=67280 RepID=UPI003654B788